MWNLLFVGEPSWSIVVHSAANVERFFKETVENRFLFSYSKSTATVSLS